MAATALYKIQPAANYCGAALARAVGGVRKMLRDYPSRELPNGSSYFNPERTAALDVSARPTKKDGCNAAGTMSSLLNRPNRWNQAPGRYKPRFSSFLFSSMLPSFRSFEFASATGTKRGSLAVALSLFPFLFPLSLSLSLSLSCGLSGLPPRCNPLSATLSRVEINGNRYSRCLPYKNGVE